MGRPKLKIDTPALLDLRSQGKSIKEISHDFGISTATLSRRIAELEYKEGIITKYRELQHLQLTALQYRVLEFITPEKINNTSLLDLVKAYNILGKANSRLIPKNSQKVIGLIDYLLNIEHE